MKTTLLAIDRIEVPPWAQRPTSKVSDDLLRKSVERGGIQQPLIVVEHGGGYILAKGLRRLRVARSLALGKVPVSIDTAPDGVEPEAHARRLRFILNEHRQDLLPSQKGELVWTLKSRFGMNNADVAAYLGVAADSITNWLAVRQYIPSVAKAMDAGSLSMNSARVFDGMTDEGQRAIWKQHGPDILGQAAALSHKLIRDTYPPDLFPRYYRQPELVSTRLGRVSGKRKSKPRATISPADKRKLMASFEMRESELRNGEDDLKRLNREINAAVVPVGAIMRSDALWAMVPDEMKPELERFSEVYV